MTRRLRWQGVAVLAMWASVGVCSAAHGQSLTAGEVSGVIRDSSGAPLREALVTLTDVATGVSRAVAATHNGLFHLVLVAPGEYQLLIEHLGFRPVRVLGVGVRSGAQTDVAVTLTAARPPVTRVDTMRVAPPISAGPGEWLSPTAVRVLPDESGDLAELGRLSSRAGPDLAALGLPGAFSGVVLDGIPYRPPRHPALPAGQFDSGVLRGSTIDRAALIVNGTDVEWAGFGGATLSAFSRQGTPSFQAHFYAEQAGGSLASSQYFDPGSAAGATRRGGLFVSGPIGADSGQFVIGVDARRVETPFPATLAGAVADSVVSVAQDSFKVDLGGYLLPRVASTDAVTAYTGFKWQTSAASSVTVTARYATASTSDADLGPGPVPTLGAALDTRDLAFGAALASGLSAHVAQELRVAVQVGTRTDGEATPPATQIVDLGMPFGSDPILPGRFHRTTIRVSETLHFDAGAHRFKIGGGPTFSSYEDTYGYDLRGAFTFSSVADFERLRGEFVQSVLTSPTAQYSVPAFGVFVQDQVAAARGFDLLVGLRFDREGLPWDKVVANQAWLSATGVSNTAFPHALGKVSPRIGLTWDVAQRHSTEFHAAAGVYFDDLSPGLLDDAITQSLGDTVHAGLGSLAAWPAPPDAAHAPAMGARLTVLAPKIQAPRMARASVGIRQSLGGGLIGFISGTYNHGDFLPRRADLNLLPAPSAHDQYGRPIYGSLTQLGTLIAVQPGTNRRFAAFDVVSAIEPDGYSDYWGITVGLDRQVGPGLHLLANYTYSKTTDNWLAGRGLPADLSPFPGGLDGVDWTDGRSDFDAPHRVVVAAEVHARGRVAPRIAFVYRYQSGAPFTPGFPPGVDVSGTGSGTDPAYVDASVGGMTSLLSQWSCLSSQAGRFAARNSCRDPGVQSLDVRLTLDLMRLGHAPVTLVVDGLNLLESDVGTRDHAVYAIDPAGTLATNPANGIVTVPFIANPDFGSVLVHRTTGRTLRIGLRVNY